MEIYLNQDTKVTSRQTYSLLEWLGDVGGLADALYIIGYIMLGEIELACLKDYLLTKIFRLKPKERASDAKPERNLSPPVSPLLPGKLQR